MQFLETYFFLSCNNIIFFKLIQPRQKALAGPGVYEARERVSGAGKVAPGGHFEGLRRFPGPAVQGEGECFSW